MPGLFVAFEGGDGVGKTTQINFLAEALTDLGFEVLKTYQPGDYRVGEQIRKLLLNPETGELDAKAEALLYAADKAQHLAEVVRPALARGAIVLSDRYLDSMLAYQGAGRKLPDAEVAQLAGWAISGLLPDLTVLLDMDPGEAIGNIAEKDRLEAAGLEFHQRVRQGFLDLAKRDPQRYLVLYARAPKAENAAAILAKANEILAKKAAQENE